MICCKECNEMFDPFSFEKRKAGGLFNHCPDCAEEHTTKYLGLQSGDGKQAGISILAFESETDRNQYKRFWANNSGLHKSKSCQLGNHLSTTPGVKFKTVTQSEATNHKGKA